MRSKTFFEFILEYGALNSTQLKLMARNNDRDVTLYNRAQEDLNATLSRQPKSFWKELTLFKQMRSRMCPFLLLFTSAPPLIQSSIYFKRSPRPTPYSPHIAKASLPSPLSFLPSPQSLTEIYRTTRDVYSRKGRTAAADV